MERSSVIGAKCERSHIRNSPPFWPASTSFGQFRPPHGVTARQVNNWVRGRACARMGRLLAVALQDVSPESRDLARGDGIQLARNPWRPANADTAAARRAMTRLALRYHPDKGGRPEHMTRINAAYETARHSTSARR